MLPGTELPFERDALEEAIRTARCLLAVAFGIGLLIGLGSREDPDVPHSTGETPTAKERDGGFVSSCAADPVALSLDESAESAGVCPRGSRHDFPGGDLTGWSGSGPQMWRDQASAVRALEADVRQGGLRVAQSDSVHAARPRRRVCPTIQRRFDALPGLVERKCGGSEHIGSPPMRSATSSSTSA